MIKSLSKQIYRTGKKYTQIYFPTIYKAIDRYKIYVKYIISGGTAAVTDLSILYVLTDWLGLWYLLSAVLAFAIAFFVSFYLQKFWTFRDMSRERIRKQMTLYFSVASVNLTLNAGGMYVLVDKLEIWYMLAQVIMGALIACESFLIYKFIIFSARGGSAMGGKKHKKELFVSGDDKLKLLIATGIFPPDIGGPAIHAKALSEELPKLGCEVKVVTYGDTKSLNVIRNTLYIINRRQNILSRYIKYFWLVQKLAKWADVVYILDLMSAGFPATLAAKARRKKVVFRTGGDFLWEKACQQGWTNLPLDKYYQQQKKNIQEKFLFFFCRWILKKIDIVIFSTELQSTIYHKHYDVPRDKIRQVTNAIPELNVSRKDNQYQDCIVFAGRLVKLKSIKRLISAFSQINNPIIKLLIFGKGPERKDLETKIKNLKLEDRVEIKESVNQEKLLEIIAGCKFVVLPSLTEISPNLALECLSMAKPILLTKYTGLDKEIMKYIITVNPLSEDDLQEKMKYLLKPDNLNKYINKLKEVEIEKRSWQDVAKDNLKIINELKYE